MDLIECVYGQLTTGQWAAVYVTLALLQGLVCGFRCWAEDGDGFWFGFIGGAIVGPPVLAGALAAMLFIADLTRSAGGYGWA